VLASYYDSCDRDRLNPCGLTSSGAVFRADLPDNAASPLLPDGTVILAYNPKTGDASVLRITNAGPYSGERKLDVSRAAAGKLGFRQQGVAALVISVLQSPTKSEANYVGRRVYPSVPGYLGSFATVDIALETARARLGLPEEGAQLADDMADDMGLVVEVSVLEAGLVPRPQLAVSPSLARELVILRSPPQPVNRDVQLVEGPRLVQGPRLVSRGPRLVQGPRLVSQADFVAQQSLEQTGATSRTLDDGN
jgi:rare lipoprotein A